MYRTVMDRLPDYDILIMAAAVADYKLVKPETSKISRAATTSATSLQPTTDILLQLPPSRATTNTWRLCCGVRAEAVARARARWSARGWTLSSHDIARSISASAPTTTRSPFTPGGGVQGGEGTQETMPSSS